MTFSSRFVLSLENGSRCEENDGTFRVRRRHLGRAMNSRSNGTVLLSTLYGRWARAGARSIFSGTGCLSPPIRSWRTWCPNKPSPRVGLFGEGTYHSTCLYYTCSVFTVGPRLMPFLLRGDSSVMEVTMDKVSSDEFFSIESEWTGRRRPATVIKAVAASRIS